MKLGEGSSFSRTAGLASTPFSNQGMPPEGILGHFTPRGLCQGERLLLVLMGP